MWRHNGQCPTAHKDNRRTVNRATIIARGTVAASMSRAVEHEEKSPQMFT